MKPLLTLALTILLLNPLNSFAGHNEENHLHKNTPANSPLTNVKVNSNEVLLEVHGIVCSFCSKGIQKKLSKLSFVDRSKYIKGSMVEIEKQKITVAIKPGEKADISAMYEAVRSGGYEPSAAYMLGDNNDVIKFNAEGIQ